MDAERLPGIRPPSPVHLIYHYVHPMDECPNGGAEWRVAFDEIAPGLLDIRHPNCARCFAEPLIDSFEVVDGPAPHDRFVSWPETKTKMVEIRQRRQPHQETELITDDDRGEA